MERSHGEKGDGGMKIGDFVRLSENGWGEIGQPSWANGEILVANGAPVDSLPLSKLNLSRDDIRDFPPRDAIVISAWRGSKVTNYYSPHLNPEAGFRAWFQSQVRRVMRM